MTPSTDPAIHTQIGADPLLSAPPSQIGAETVPPVEFPELAPVRFCSFNECSSGHRWPPTLIAQPCPGCQGPILAAQKTQCPFCNEPITRTVLRSDFIPRGGGLVARCAGAAPIGETMDIELIRHEWSACEVDGHKLFETKQSEERAAMVKANA